MSQAKQCESEPQSKTPQPNLKIDASRLQLDLLNLISSEIGASFSREEYDLLQNGLLTSNKVGFLKFFSICEKNDFVLSTYEKLREKIIAVVEPTVELDEKIRFFSPSQYTLRTQEQIEAIVNEKISKPTPLNEICTAKNLSVSWFQYGDSNNIGIRRLRIINSFAIELSKAIISKAKDDRFSWLRDKDGNPNGCAIEIQTSDELSYFLGDLVESKSKTAQVKIAELQDAMIQANKLEENAGFTVFFQTKAPKADKSERQAWVQPPKEHYTLTDLKERKWNTRLIEKYLDEPDVYFHNLRNRFVPTHGYEIARVKKIEKSSAFKADFQLNRQKPVKIAK